MNRKYSLIPVKARFIAPKPYADAQEYFKDWSVVNSETLCWEWQGRLNTAGYGVIHYSPAKLIGTTWAHRASYMVFVGPIASRDIFACHKCDNKKCINPEHLFLGTNQDNIADCIAKGRFRKPRGSDNGLSKLSEEDILLIRMALSEGRVQKDIAKEYNVTQSCISRVNTGNIWGHI